MLMDDLRERAAIQIMAGIFARRQPLKNTGTNIFEKSAEAAVMAADALINELSKRTFELAVDEAVEMLKNESARHG
jgi:hypothetical protein